MLKYGIEWATEQVPLKKLKGYDKNPREISEANRERLKKSLNEYSQVKALLVDTDYVVLGGNQRLSIMKTVFGPDEMIWVRKPVRPLTDAERKAIPIAHNVKIGDWDFTKLEGLEIPDDILVDEYGFDREVVNEFGFDFDELDFDDMDDAKVIKKFLIRFETGFDTDAFTEEVCEKLSVTSFEKALLILTKRYENNNT